MLTFVLPASDPARLRSSAEIRLRNGTAPRTRGWAVGGDALGALYRLASNPDTAGEGLKLLQELQAYQVELDLQYEQLQANDSDSVEQIARYRALFDGAPLSYFVLGRDACIIEANGAGALQFGMDQHAIRGCSIDKFLRPDGKFPFGWQLKQLFCDKSEISCLVRAAAAGDGGPLLHVIARLAPGGEAILLMVCEYKSPAAA